MLQSRYIIPFEILSKPVVFQSPADALPTTIEN